MKRRVPSFLAGVLTTLLAVAMTTTALAASGAISYNGATVTVGGTAQAAGDITTANGQAPGSIQFTDAAGNVTHYLPLETIDQLPGVDAAYDPVTKTVKLERVPVWVKQEETENGMVSYVCDAPDEMYTTPPDWAITQVPEGWTLESVGNFGGNSQNYDYRNGSGRLTFTCSYPSDGSFGWGAGYPEALDTCRTVMVNGYEADLYFYNDRAMLAWEDKDGLLFFFTADEMDPDTLVEVASSVAPASDAVPDYEAGWLPEGYSLFETNTSAGTVETTWIGRGGNITLTYSTSPLLLPEGSGKTVKLDNVNAKFWEAKEPHEADEDEWEPQTEGSVTITTGTISGPRSADVATLAWTDADTGVHFRLHGTVDQDTLVRIARSVREK